jgi:hypothetical protein
MASLVWLIPRHKKGPVEGLRQLTSAEKVGAAIKINPANATIRSRIDLDGDAAQWGRGISSSGKRDCVLMPFISAGNAGDFNDAGLASGPILF